GQAARRPAQRRRRCRAGGGVRRPLRRPRRTHLARGGARHGRRRHRGGPPAGRVPRAARDHAAADRGLPRRRRADGGRHRLQPRHLAAALAPAGDAAGLHPLPAHPRGGAARDHRARGARARACRPRRAPPGPARRLRALARARAGGAVLLARRQPRRVGARRRPPRGLSRDPFRLPLPARSPTMPRCPRPLALTLALAALALPAAAAAQATDAARALAADALIVDTHIDAPGVLVSKWADLGEAAPDREFDYPRAREGGLDVAFMSIYTSARQDDTGSAWQAANLQIDAIEALVARH